MRWIRDKKIATARNIALLWDCFVEESGASSGFVDAGVAEQTEDPRAGCCCEPHGGGVGGRRSRNHYVSVMIMSSDVGVVRQQEGRIVARIALAERMLPALVQPGPDHPGAAKQGAR